MKKIISIFLIISMIISSFCINVSADTFVNQSSYLKNGTDVQQDNKYFLENEKLDENYMMSEENIKEENYKLQEANKIMEGIHSEDVISNLEYFEKTQNKNSTSSSISYTLDSFTSQEGYNYITITFKNTPEKVKSLGFSWDEKEPSKSKFYYTDRMDYFENASIYNMIPLKNGEKTISFCLSKNNLSNHKLHIVYEDEDGEFINLYENTEDIEIPKLQDINGYKFDYKTWDDVYDNLDKINNISSVYNIIEKIKIFEDMSVAVRGGHTLKYRFPAIAFSQIQKNKDIYTSGEDIEKNMKEVLFYTFVNTYNFFADQLKDYIKVLDNFDYENFNGLNNSEKLAVASVLRLYNGYKSEKRDEIDPYMDYEKFYEFYSSLIESVLVAQKSNLNLFEDGTNTISVNEVKKIANFNSPNANERVLFDVEDSSVLSAGEGKVVDNGLIYGQSYGYSDIVYVRFTNEKGNAKIFEYSVEKFKTEDLNHVVAYSYRQESGRNNMMMVAFPNSINISPNSTMKLSDFAKELKIGGKIVDLEVGEVSWITKNVAKVTFEKTDVSVGDVVELTFNNLKLENGNESIENSKIVTEPAVEDIYSPVAKIIPRSGNISKLEVIFNELIDDSSQVLFANEVITSAKLIKENKTEENITSKLGEISWSEQNGRSLMTIYLTTPVNVKDTDCIYIEYNDKIKDYSGNSIDNRKKSMPIGGGFSPIENYIEIEEGTKSILDAIRNFAGGKTPKIAISASSSSPYKESFDYFHEKLDGVQAAYGFALMGMEPIIAEITSDTYNNEEIIEKTVKSYEECTGMFGPGGDQSMNSRAYLNDDGSDTIQMRALRQIYYSGGIVSGSSAGDHSLSNPMLNGGTSSQAITRNDIMTNKVYEFETSVSDGRPLIMKGFGFADEYGLTDSHVDIRGRLGRLIVALKHLQDLKVREIDQIDKTRGIENGIGIGVDENTGIAIVDGVGYVYGASGVMISDISDAKYKESSIFAARNIRVSYLTEGDVYNFETKKVTSNKPLVTEEDIELFPSDNIFPASSDEPRKTGPEPLMRDLIQSKLKYNYGRDKENKEITLVFKKDDNTKGYYKSNAEFTVENMMLNIDIYSELNEMISYETNIEIENNKDEKEDRDKDKNTFVEEIKKPQENIQDIFVDLNNHLWAEKEIYFLAKEKVILGVGNKIYAPASNVTRADYVTILYRVFNLDPKIVEEFSDVDKNSYYYEAVSTLKSYGIITNTIENKFNPTEYISREDMFLYTYNLLVNKNKLSNKKTDVVKLFDDYNEISKGLTDAIEALCENELVIGYENKLKPQAKSTRAETAVFIYRIYNLIKENQ